MGNKLNFLSYKARSFSQIVTPASVLNYRGSANISWETIQAHLERGRFPDDLRGNFAFVWNGANDTIAAVDHLASIPLFYSKTTIAPSFYDLCNVTEPLTVNPRAEAEATLMGGITLSERTLYNEISFLRPGHYLKNGKQKRFIDLLEVDDQKELDKERLRDLIESTITKNTQENNAVLFSAGTDSLALYAAIKSQKALDKFKFLYIYSPIQTQTEKLSIENEVQELGIHVNYFETIPTGNEPLPGDLFKRLHTFWKNRDYLPKRYAIHKMGLEDHVIFTGHIGDHLMGGPKTPYMISHAFQCPKVDPYDFARLYLHQCLSYNNASSVVTPHVESYTLNSPLFSEVYEELIETLASWFSKMKTKDLINRIFLLNFLAKGSFRMMPYAQDNVAYFHPFSRWEVVKEVQSLKSEYKINNDGTIKHLFYQLWESDLPISLWRKPKIGLQLPESKYFRT